MYLRVELLTRGEERTRRWEGDDRSADGSTENGGRDTRGVYKYVYKT